MEVPERDRSLLVAAALSLLAHAGLAAWLLQLQGTPLRGVEQALQVVWIDAPVPRAPARGPDEPTQTPPAVNAPAPARAPRPPASTALQAVELPAPAAPGAPAAAPALHEQARSFARSQLPADTFERDPLRHRPAARADGRFVMPDPVSAEDVVIAIGQLFGGGPTDPCPRIRRNLANADMGAGRELAEEELRRLRRNCL